MKNKLLYYALAFFIFSVCSCSCDKSGDENIQPSFLIPQEVKDYTFFKEGTYWIYKDSASGIEDSVYVYYSYQEYDTLSANNSYGLAPGIYEWFEVKTRSEFYHYDYYYNLNSSFISYSPLHVSVFREKSKPGDYVGATVCFIYPPTIGITSYWYNDVTTVNNFYGNYNIGGNTYSNVVNIYETKNVTENDQKTHLFFAKNFGLVRKELIDSLQVWNMIRKNIIQ